MPSVYSGDAGNISKLVPIAIASSTNASPIVVQTSTTLPAGLQDGDTVDVSGHLVNLAADGRWQITIVDTTHFSLNGSTGSGVGAATGFVYPQALQAPPQIPSDGDNRNAASVNVALETDLDRTAWAGARIGPYYMAGIMLANNSGAIGAPDYATATVPSGGGFVGFSPVVELSAGPFPDIYAIPGDLIEFVFDFDYNVSSAGSYDAYFDIAMSVVGGSTFAVPGSLASVEPSGANGGHNHLTICAMYGPWPTGGVPPGSEFTAQLRGATGSATSETYNIEQNFTLLCKIWRPT